MAIRPITPKRGNALRGVHVSDTKFVGVATLAELQNCGLRQPSSLQNATKKEIKKDVHLASAVSLRDLIQRRMDKPRIDRARAFARYIQANELEGKPGGTPAITLYVEQAHEGDDCGELVIPFGSDLVCADGETQTEARFRLAYDEEFNKPESAGTPFAIVVYHDIDDGFAMQILHDLNRFAHPITEKLLIAKNTGGPVTKAIVDVISAAQIDDAKVNRFSDKPGKKQLIAWNQVAWSIIGYTMRQSALKSDAKCFMDAMNDPVSSPPINGDTVARLANLVTIATESEDARIGSLPLWQVAGVLTQEGREPGSLNWAAARMAAKGKVKGKLQRIATSF